MNYKREPVTHGCLSDEFSNPVYKNTKNKMNESIV